MRKIEKIVRIVIAIAIGEIILVFGTTFAQEIIFDGVSWFTSAKYELQISGFVSFLAAVLSGSVAYLIVKQASRIPTIALSILVFLETIWLIQTDRSQEPMWSSALAGAVLILGFWVGRLFIIKFRIATNK